MRCPYCQNDDSKVIDTTHDNHGGIRRRRECLKCGQRFSSYERPILATPLIVKQDGTREEFDRGKLERGIRIACAKRPVSAEDIERMIGQVEGELQRMGKSEVSSRVIGDLVIHRLKEMDQTCAPAISAALTRICWTFSTLPMTLGSQPEASTI